MFHSCSVPEMELVMDPVVGDDSMGGVCSASLTRFVFALRRAFGEISVEDPQPRSTCISYFSSIVDWSLSSKGRRLGG